MVFSLHAEVSLSIRTWICFRMQIFVLPVSCSSHLDLVLFIILINDLELAWLNFKMIPKLVFPGQLTQQLGAAESSDLTSLSPLLAVECPRLWLWHFFRLSSLIHWIGRKTSGFIYFCLFVFLEFSTAKGFNWLSRNRGHQRLSTDFQKYAEYSQKVL